MTKENIILLADAYKYSHHKLYLPGTEYIYSYLESRGGLFDETVFFGLQYFLKEYLEGEVITMEKIDEAEKVLESVFGRKDIFDRTKFEYIVEKHGGKLPIKITAVGEGSVVNVKNALMTIENTDPNCYWLPNFLETLLMQIWYPTTVATLSREVKKVVKNAYERTASKESYAGIDFVLNDFGFRGVSSVESAGLGDAGHLINFKGSDTIQGSVFASRYYNAEIGFGKSVPATEHSICTLLGKEGELEMYKHILKTIPNGIIACVSDSYDIFKACEQYWGTDLKEQILNRNGVLVIRPDSGNPIKTLLKVFSILFDKFGFTVNEKGFQVLPSQVRVIQGDGVNYDSIIEIYEALEDAKISAENLVLGMGGALLQKVDRDTQQFAMKCSYAVINDKGVNVQKAPIEMNNNGKIISSFKKSKAGRFSVIRDENNQFKTIEYAPVLNIFDVLHTVFKNGELINSNYNNWHIIRARAKI